MWSICFILMSVFFSRFQFVCLFVVFFICIMYLFLHPCRVFFLRNMHLGAIIPDWILFSSGKLFNHLNSEFYKHNFAIHSICGPILFGHWSLQSVAWFCVYIVLPTKNVRNVKKSCGNVYFYFDFWNAKGRAREKRIALT